jgi:hypothetical protein
MGTNPLPTSIYVPLPIEVANYDFEQSPGTLPPTGWMVGGGDLSADATPTYDSTTPYEGSLSLVITATTILGGLSAIAVYKVVPGELYQIQAAIRSISGDMAWAQFNFFDASGNPLGGPDNGLSYSPGVSTTSSAWQLLTSQGTVPPGAVTGRIQLYLAGASGGTAEYDVIQVTRLSTAPEYYLNLLTSQYQGNNSPKLQAFLALLMQPFVDCAVCASSMAEAFDLAMAVGVQLDAIGTVLGVPRRLPFQPTGGVSAVTTAIVFAPGSLLLTVSNTTNMVVGVPVQIGGSNPETVVPTAINPGVSFTAVFANPHVSGVPVTTAPTNPVLMDSDYRILLQAKVIQNQFNGQYMGANSTLWQDWQAMFPGGHIYITDNQNMTATVFLVGGFSPIQQQMITNGLIVPQAQAVEFTYEFAELPVFGFDDLNPAFVAGFDVGKWA